MPSQQNLSKPRHTRLQYGLIIGRTCRISCNEQSFKWMRLRKATKACPDTRLSALITRMISTLIIGRYIGVPSSRQFQY